LAAARAEAGERVIDVGCGCGVTTIDFAARVAPGGQVLGLDISAPMLARPRGFRCAIWGDNIRTPSTCRERIRLSQPLEWHRLSARLRHGNTRQEYADDEPAGNAEVRAARRLTVVR
jgi:SAM-dependent methyltransferase